MLTRVAADAVLVAHLGFILFVTLGALAAFRYRWVVLLHLPAAAWGVFIEISGGACPLTGLEKHLRRAAGEAGYSGGFIEHWLLSIIYPSGLTREIQFLLAGALILINLIIYGLLIYRYRDRSSMGT